MKWLLVCVDIDQSHRIEFPANWETQNGPSFLACHSYQNPHKMLPYSLTSLTDLDVFKMEAHCYVTFGFLPLPF